MPLGALPFVVGSKMSLHSLAIRAVLGLSVESAVVTAGGDGSVVVSDPSKQQVVWRFNNAEAAAAFSSLQWDSKQGLLFVGDDLGSIHVFNVYSNERVAEQQVCTARVAFLLEDPGRPSLRLGKFGTKTALYRSMTHGRAGAEGG